MTTRFDEAQLAEVLAANPAVKVIEEKKGQAVGTRRILDALDALESSAIDKSQPAKRSKYGNHKVTDGDLTFDSKKEHAHWLYLKSELEFGRIAKLELQPEFLIVVNGHKICTYRADFRVTYPDGRQEVIDVKSAITKKHPVYRLKAKLMLAVWAIEIQEI